MANIVEDHPAVKISPLDATIGIMAVKKTNDRIYLYFAHNTESFVSLGSCTVCHFNSLSNHYLGSCFYRW